MTMKKRFYLSLIVLAVLLLALGGLVVRSTAAVVRSMAGLRPTPAWPRDGAAPASMPSRAR
jgi:hypothetical protein